MWHRALPHPPVTVTSHSRGPKCPVFLEAQVSCNICSTKNWRRDVSDPALDSSLFPASMIQGSSEKWWMNGLHRAEESTPGARGLDPRLSRRTRWKPFSAGMAMIWRNCFLSVANRDGRVGGGLDTAGPTFESTCRER